jgi:Protein of unknown function, DUF255
MCNFRGRQTDDWQCSFDFDGRRTSLSGRGGGDICILNSTGGRGLLLLPLVMWGLVASAAGQTNPNHLAGEQSRYLSRGMNQPVDWYPWNAGTFKRAKELHRPIPLDVGAVWYLWCALMDRDTYTNVDTANYITYLQSADGFSGINRRSRPKLFTGSILGLCQSIGVQDYHIGRTTATLQIS